MRFNVKSSPLFTHYLLALLLPLVLAIAAIPALTDYRFNSLMQQKMDEVIHRQQLNSASVDNTLARLSANLQYSCSQLDKSLMQGEYRRNPFIRVIGMSTPDGRYCSTLGDSYVPNFRNLSFIHHANGADYYLGRVRSELALKLRSPKGRLYMLISSHGSTYVADRPCIDCFYIKISIANNELVADTGDANILREFNVSQLQQQLPASHTQFTVWGGKNLHQYSQSWAYQLMLTTGIIAGLLCLTGVLLWEKRQNSLARMLHQAIEQHELRPLYQPIVDARSGKTVGYEALIRWYHKGECIAPGAFIDFAETSGLIMPMTDQLLQQVIDDLPKLPADTWVSLNIVAAHLESDALTKQLAALNWPSPTRLRFELTERQPITDIVSAKRHIAQLARRGYRLKIDDFGTGFGGMASLQQLDITSIKIDKMFVDTIGTDDFKAGVLDSLIKFGHDFELEMIAEGVETAQQAHHLLQLGVYLHQGYLYSKPGNVTTMQIFSAPSLVPATA